MYLLGRHRAIRNQQKHLAEYALWTVERADSVLVDATSALREIEALSLVGCTDEHIKAMRLAVLKHRAIQEMGYFPSGYLECTSWGLTIGGGPHHVDYRTSTGIDVSTNVNPLAGNGFHMLAFAHGAHNVLVHPLLTIDIFSGPETSLVLASSSGAVVSTLNDPDAGTAMYAMAHRGSGSYRGNLYVTYQTKDWIGIAIEPQSSSHIYFEQEWALLLTVGLLFAAFAIGLIFWMVRRRLSPLAELGLAIRHQEFLAYYQPIIELSTRRCVGAEALIRWHRPDGSILGPAHFIPLAEESGLIKQITVQLIHCVLDDMQEALRLYPDLHLSLNLSASDMESGSPLPLLADLLRQWEIPAQQIWLEATERSFIRADAARETLVKAREQGHPISIDDFGTGYSSLALLHSLPLDALKIDKTFVDAIDKESATSSVIPHIINMATQLNLYAVAEGIETEAQLRYLQQRGVRYGQGWLFAKAMPRDEFLAYYERHKDLTVPQ